MKIPFQNILTTSYVILLAGILAASILAYKSSQSVATSNRLVQHTQEVLYQAGQIFSLTKDVSVYVRTFVITNDTSFLKPYVETKEAIDSRLSDLKKLVQDKPVQRQRVDTLHALIDKRIEFSLSVIESRRRNGFNEASHLIASGEGEYYVSEVQGITQRILDEENRLMEQRKEKNEKSNLVFAQSFYTLLVCVAVMLTILFFSIRNSWGVRKKGEERFRALLETAPDAMVIVNNEGVVQLVNAQTENLFGYKREEILGQKVEALIPKRFGDIHAKHRSGFFTAPTTRSMGTDLELYGMKKNGNEFPVEVSLSPLLSDDGISVSAAIRDITERKNAEGKFKGLLESAPDAMVIADQKGIIQLVNAQTERLFQYKRDEMIGQKVEFLMPGRYQENHIGHRDLYFSKPKTRAMGQGLELYGRRKDGSEFSVEISLSPLHTNEGALVSAAIRDITDRKKRDQLLEESERKFNKAFQASPAGIVITRMSDSKIVEVNESFSKMLGFTREELIGHNVDEVGIKIDHSKRDEVYAQLKGVGVVNNAEMEIEGKSGKSISAFYSVQLLQLRDVPHALTVIYDITELKKAEQKVNVLNKELEAFSYSVSHDMRAPLRSINGYADILAEDYEDKLDEQGKKVLSSITRNAKRMGQLIDDMLNFSKIGRSTIKSAVIDMNNLVKKILSELPAPANRMTRFTQADLPSANGDLDLITQVWVNYIINAIKFSSKKEEPVIEIGYASGEKEIEYFVRDNGSGFDNQYNHKLFGVFQRLHKQTEFEGTGVGLAIVKRIVEKHQGRVWAEGKPNRGAVFYFSLPKN